MMKTFAQALLLTLVCGTLYGQDLAGQWQGALHVQGTELRIVFNIEKTNDLYKATMDSPDQNVTGTLVTHASLSHPNVKFEIANSGIVYEGEMIDNVIYGKWMQSGTWLFLKLAKSGGLPDRKK